MDLDKVIEACETLKAYCGEMEDCDECPLETHCSDWISPLMEQFIEDLKHD